MLTTRRNTTNSSEGGSAIDVLDRRSASAFDREVSTEERAQEREIMHRNLNKLLYGEPSVEEEIPVEEEPKLEVKEQAIADEDIRPTSTTMQFGDGDVSHVYNDMEMQKDREKNGYKLNSKGKIVVMLYALTVMVILALIVINTGVLASLKRTNQARAEELGNRIAMYGALTEEINAVSADDYVISVAENTYGMIKGN